MATVQGAHQFQQLVQEGIITAADIALILASTPGAVFNRFDYSLGTVDAQGTWLSSNGDPLISSTGEVINDAYIISHGMTLDPYYGMYVINPTTGELLVDANGNFVLSANAVGATPENLTTLLQIISSQTYTPTIVGGGGMTSLFLSMFGLGGTAALGGVNALDLSAAVSNQPLTLTGGTNTLGGAAAAIVSENTLGADGGTEIVGSNAGNGEDVGLS